MSAKADLSGLEDFIATLEGALDAIPTINKDFIGSGIYDQFLEEATRISPYDTGELVNSYNMTDPVQTGSKTRADFENLAEHASFPNYGTSKQPPQYFWERSMQFAKTGMEQRYQQKFSEKFEG